MTARRPRVNLVPVEQGSLQLEMLDPDVLSPVAMEAVQALLGEGESPNTARSYRSAIHYWTGWFAMRYGRALSLPVPVPVVVQFIVDHVERKSEDGHIDEKGITGEKVRSELPAEIDAALVQAGYKSKLGAPALATVIHRVSVLSKAHQLRSAKNPCQEAVVRELLLSSKKSYTKRGVRPEKKPALTQEPLQAMLDTCDGSLRGVRDRALLLFAFCSGGRRRSEVTQATMANVKRVSPDAFVFELVHTKTNQAGKDGRDSAKPVVDVAADALAHWLQLSGITSGPIFRRVRRGDHVGEPLTPSAVRDIVMDRAALAGLSEQFSAHSIRSGFVTEAARQKVPIPEAMAMTGHTSVESLMGYFRTEASLDSTGARLIRRIHTAK